MPMLRPALPPCASRPDHDAVGVPGVQKLNKRVAFVREVIGEVAGFSPYEKRTMELLKVGKEKRALKLLKAKLGTRHTATRRERAGRSEGTTDLLPPPSLPPFVCL